MQEMQYKLRAWWRNPDKEPLEAQILLIYEHVTLSFGKQRKATN